MISTSKSTQTIQSQQPKILRHKILGFMLKEIRLKYLDEMDVEILRNKAPLETLGVEGGRQHPFYVKK